MITTHNATGDSLHSKGFALLRHFFEFRYLFHLIPLFFLVILGYGIYLSHLNDIKHDLKNEAQYIGGILQQTFDFYAQLLLYISRQIAVADTEDVHTIAKIIGRDIDQNDSLSWINVGWANSKNMFVFDCTRGSLDPPYNLSQRPYIQDCIKDPGKFHTSQVVMGIALGIRIIPSGIGVTNSKGRYLGTLCGGFKLVDLNYRVQQKLKMANFNDTSISYIVLDRDLHIVLKSSDNKMDIESSYYRDALVSPKVFVNDEGVLSAPIEYKDITYTHYRKVKNFPYYVLTGLNTSAARSSFFGKLLPFVASILIIALYCALLIYFDRKRILKYADASEKAKFNFLRRIKSEMKTPLNSILTYCQIITRALRQDPGIEIKVDKQLEILDKIHEAAVNLSSLTTDALDLSYVNVNAIIQECILIHSHTALIRGIKIKTFLHPNPPPLAADELRFKQIITGLISLSLGNSPKGSLIKILTTLKTIGDQNFLELIIQDDGFALDEEEIRCIHDKIEGMANEENNPEFVAIEKLIKMHEGTLQVESKWNNGKKITIIFPYKVKDTVTVLFQSP